LYFVVGLQNSIKSQYGTSGKLQLRWLQTYSNQLKYGRLRQEGYTA